MVNAFYDEVAKAIELPIVIYNFPGRFKDSEGFAKWMLVSNECAGICNGVDLDSDTIAGIAKRNPGKVVGVKLTCGSVAKITRLTAEL